MQALAAGYLACLDVSWNSLRGDTARALHETLALNGSLQQLVLSYNGFGDMDSALVLKGLTQHGGCGEHVGKREGGERGRGVWVSLQQLALSYNGIGDMDRA